MSDDDSPLAGTEVHFLESAHVGDRFKIFVARCGESDAPVPVLYVTDANGMFGLTVDAVRGMQLSNFLPPLLVVGIGYPLGGLAETVVIRTRDLTPTVFEAYARLVPDRPLGGAPAFLGFIRDELRPWVHARYDVAPSDATYFGHSLGGLFGAYTLFHEPDIFRRYILGSPSLWWDERVTFSFESEYAARHDDLRADVFLAIGANETHDGRLREAAAMPPDERALTAAHHLDMVADVTRLADRLRARRYPGLRLHTLVLPDEFHVTVAPVVLTRGLRALFESPR